MTKHSLSVLILIFLSAGALAQDEEAIEGSVVMEKPSTPIWQGQAGDYHFEYVGGQGFSMSTPEGDFKLGISGWGKAQFNYVEFDDDLPFRSEDEIDFSIEHARLDFHGHVLWPELTFRMQLDLAGATDEVRFTRLDRSRDDDVELLDFYGDWRPYEWFGFQFGQFKTPFGRQQLIEEAALQFIDRGFVTRELTHKRDTGIMVHGGFGTEDMQNLVEYSAGIFDGEGINTTSTSNGVMVVLRVGLNPLGDVGYSHEGDPDMSEEPKLGIGVSWLFDPARNDSVPTGAPGVTQSVDTDIQAVGVDAAFRYQGVSLQGEYIFRREDPEDPAVGPITSLGSNDGYGWYIQAGVLCPWSEHWEAVARYERLDIGDFDSTLDGFLLAGTDLSGVQDIDIITVGINYYIDGHPWKAQVDYSFIDGDNVETGDDADFSVVRTAILLSF